MVIAALLSSVFGIYDYLFGLLQNLNGFRAEGLGLMLETLLAGQVVYLIAGLAFGILFLVCASVFKPGRVPSETFAWESGVITALFSFLLMFSLTPPAEKWKTLLFFAAVGPVSVFAGYGAKNFWGAFLEKFLGGPVKAAYIIFQATVLAAMFIMFRTLRLPAPDHSKTLIVPAAAALFIFSVWLARLLLKNKSGARLVLYLVFLAFGIFLPALGYRPAPKAEIVGKPAKALNIIWIIADACRADGLGVYSGKNQTPNLDQIAREGVLFKNAFSQGPWTIPSAFSMTTSLYPSAFQSRYQFRTYYSSSKKTEPIAERLQGFGYHTAIVTANYAVGQPDLLVRGFDHLLAVHNAYQLQRTRYYRVLLRVDYLVRRFFGWSQIPDSIALVTKKCEKFLAQPEAPFFLWVHYLSPHSPYNPPARFIKNLSYSGGLRPPFFAEDPFHLPEDVSHPQSEEINLGFVMLDDQDKQFVRELYLANIRYLDEQVGGLVNFIKAQGLEKNTVIIFAADHGEELWDHGQCLHGQSLYDELTHVPLIIWGAGIAPRVVEEPVALIDLVPTLAELIGIEPNPIWQGKSFASTLLTGSLPLSSREIFAEGTMRPEELKAIRMNGYKLIVGMQSGRHWLFDLNQDPGEQKNIYAADLPIAKELEAKLNLWQAQNLYLKNKLRSQEMTPGERKDFEERLRALGYVK